MLGEVEVLGNSPIARTGVPCIFDDDPVVRLPGSIQSRHSARPTDRTDHRHRRRRP